MNAFKTTALAAALAACTAAGAATVTLDGTRLTIEDAWAVAEGKADVAIAPEAMRLLEDSHKLVMASAAKGQAVYGLTVGVGLNKDQKLFPPTGRSLPKCSKPRARSITTRCAPTPRVRAT